MSTAHLYVIGICVIAFAFDFINGFHDAANSIATVVATRVLRPLQAVAWAACFNFLAAFGFGVHVATTMGKGTVPGSAVGNDMILASLLPTRARARSLPHACRPRSRTTERARPHLSVRQSEALSECWGSSSLAGLPTLLLAGDKRL